MADGHTLLREKKIHSTFNNFLDVDLYSQLQARV